MLKREDLEYAQRWLSRVTVVVDQQCLGSTMKSLFSDMGWPIPEKVKDSRQHGNTTRALIGNDTLYRELLQRNRLDIELYQWGKRIAWKRCPETAEEQAEAQARREVLAAQAPEQGNAQQHGATMRLQQENTRLAQEKARLEALVAQRASPEHDETPEGSATIVHADEPTPTVARPAIIAGRYFSPRQVASWLSREIVGLSPVVRHAVLDEGVDGAVMDKAVRDEDRQLLRELGITKRLHQTKILAHWPQLP